MKHKLLSILLSLSLVIGLLPTVALADEPAAGTGESENNIAAVYNISGDTAIQSYTSLTAAAQAAGTGTYVKLLTNVEEEVPGTNLGEFCLILDLNGHNFTGKITKDHDLTIRDTSTEKSGTARLNYVQCNVLTLEGGTVTIDDASIDHTTKLTGANVTINGGEYRIRNTYTKAIDFTEGTGTLTVNGGIFNTTNSLSSDENEIISCTVKRQVTVNQPVEDVTCYIIGKKTQGSRTIQKTGSSTLYFYDLNTAALAAKDGDTIELLEDQTISKKVEIKASVTLDGKGHKVNLAETVKGINPGNYAHGVFVISGDGKTAAIKNAKFENINYDAVLIRAYNSGSNSSLTVDGCTFDNVKVINVVRAASGDAGNCKLAVTNSVFKNCAASLNGIVQIDSNSNNATSEITDNSFINNSIGSANNVAVIYLSAPAKVQNNYFESNITTANDSTKNGIIVTGSNAVGSTIEKNAFVSHKFTNGDAQGAVYGAKGATTVTTNYYADDITHLAKAGEGFTEGTAAKCYAKNENAAGVVVNADHTWNDGTVTTQPTTAAAGVKTYTCTTCNATKTETIAKLPSDSGSSSDPTYAVSTPSKTEHGTVTVSPRYAERGDTVTITVKPDSGYVLETLTVTDKNGNELTLKDKGDGKYTFTMPAGKVEVKASFAKEVETSPFTDVATDDYYYEAVKWAVKNGITTGVGNDLFAPGQPCTRAQIVTFLWRAAGSPEPKGTAAGMTDVVSGSYYEKAVAWAIENGITTGTTATTFSPDATCTRAQAVTFLARALNAKAAGKAEFSDVPADSYFADAVAWAAANGVTEGIGGGLFGSDNDCTRGQIVTFLFRAYNK